jgi:hypothetical protein
MTTVTLCITPEFRVSYPKVFKPERNDLNGSDEYSLVALFAKGADLSKLKAACKAAVEAKWGTDEKKWPKNLRMPFRDQADRAKTDDDGNEYLPDGYVEGAFYLNLKSQKRPGVVNSRNEDIIDDSDFYGGCYARAQVNAKAYDKNGNKGVSLYLNHVQKLRDGDPFGSAPRNAASVFEAIGDEGSDGGSLFD